MAMSSDMTQKLKRSLVLHEGYKNFPYLDTLGNITIGIGYNLSERGLSDEWIMKQYDDDVTYFYNRLNEDFPWFKDLNEDRQIALLDMCFMGYKKFLSFKKMITALSEQNYKRAGLEMIDSKWAQQVKGRAYMLANVMITGQYPI